MNNRNLLIILLAAISAFVGWLLSSDDGATSFETQPMFADLQKQLNEVDTLNIESADGIVITAVKSDEDWVAGNQGNYPLESDEVIELLNAFATAQLNDAKTAKAENYARLGLQNIDQTDSQSSLVTLNAGERRWQILVGNSSSSGNGVFVRKTGEAQSWLTRTQLSLPAETKDWLKTQILAIDASDVVSISRVDGWSISHEIEVVSGKPEQPLDTQEKTVWKLSNSPQGRELKYDSVLENTAEDILALKLESLKQLRPMDMEGLELTSVTTIDTKSLGKLTISLYQQEENWYAVYDAPELPEPAPDYQWKKWVFELSDFHAGRLTKSMEDFFTELPEENTD